MKKRYIFLGLIAMLFALVLLYLGSFPPVMGFLAQRYNHAEDDAIRHTWDRKMEVADRVYAPILWILGKYPELDRAVYQGVDYFQDVFQSAATGK